jgi:hypothetical protein
MSQRAKRKKSTAPLVFHPNPDELIRALSIALSFTTPPTQPLPPTPSRGPVLGNAVTHDKEAA